MPQMTAMKIGFSFRLRTGNLLQKKELQQNKKTTKEKYDVCSATQGYEQAQAARQGRYKSRYKIQAYDFREHSYEFSSCSSVRAQHTHKKNIYQF